MMAILPEGSVAGGGDREFVGSSVNVAGAWQSALAVPRRAMAGARTNRPIMVVSHDATRTGAPRVAADIARAIEASGRRVSFLLRWNGPLRSEMEDASSSLHLEPLRRIRAALRMRFPSAGWVSRVEELAAFVALVVHRPSLVYVNTVKSACYVRPARWLGHPVVLHVHELEPMASRTLSRYRLERSYRDIVLVGCSRPTVRNLARIAEVPERAVREVLSLIDADAGSDSRPRQQWCDLRRQRRPGGLGRRRVRDGK